MRKAYTKPLLEVESYTLDMAIAANCAIVVTNGPAMGDIEQCPDYEDPFGGISLYGSASNYVYNVHFYEETNCDCYYSSSENGYWMS